MSLNKNGKNFIVCFLENVDASHKACDRTGDDFADSLN